MSKVLVTGGGGFIGANLVRALLERGDEVKVLDNFATGNRANLDGLDIEIVEGELRSYERVPRSVQDPLTTSAVNVEGTLNVLLAARDEGVRRVVFASSSSVYGSSAELPARESGPVDPISPYGVAKLAAERYCVSFSRVYHAFETVVLRYFNVFGPRQNPHSEYAAAVPLFITAIARGEPVTVFGDGGQARDFTYVANVVDANLRAAEAPGANGRIFNVAAGAPHSVNDLLDTIGGLLDKPVERRNAEPRAGDIRDSFADVSAARETLGWEPHVGFEEGLRLTAMDLAQAEAAHGQIWRRFQAFLENTEYFVLPTTQLPPFDVNMPYPTEIAGVKFEHYIDWMKSCWYISATGNPAVSVPAGFTPEGLPVGLQIVGRNKEDFSVLQLAHAFEQATGFGQKHPAIA